jgi:hypothetical protein
MIDIIKPKRPAGPGWAPLPLPRHFDNLGYPAEMWFHATNLLSVISAVEVANDGDGIDKGPEYHISISSAAGMSGRPARCSSAEALWVLAQFELEGSEEDNHVPNGVVRNFWRPVADQLVGIECACKDDEPVMSEDKGDFIWRGVTK